MSRTRRAGRVAVVTAALLAVTTAATASTRMTYPESCPMPYATNPAVSVMWDQEGTGGPYAPALVRVTCGAHGCDPIQQVTVTAYDRTTGEWKGTKTFRMPVAWRRGDLRPPLFAFKAAPTSHRVMAVVTLTKPNGRHCTVTAARIRP